MSKLDWTALADRYGAQEARYREDLLDTDCRACGRACGDEVCQDCYDETYREEYSEIILPGDVPPQIDLLTLSRANQDAGAAQDGQASIALAWGALWLALVIAFAVLALCVYGAAWINGVWLAPFAGVAR